MILFTPPVPDGMNETEVLEVWKRLDQHKALIEFFGNHLTAPDILIVAAYLQSAVLTQNDAETTKISNGLRALFDFQYPIMLQVAKTMDPGGVATDTTVIITPNMQDAAQKPSLIN